jgi:hypothetical protein
VWLSLRHEKEVSRKVAKAVVISLLREVEVGVKQVEQIKNGKNSFVGELPTCAWRFLQNLLSDRHVLDAIVRYGDDGKLRDPRIGTTFGDERYEAYLAEELLSHLKNYYCYIVPQFHSITPEHFTNPIQIAEIYVGSVNVQLTLQKILNGLSKWRFW